MRITEEKFGMLSGFIPRTEDAAHLGAERILILGQETGRAITIFVCLNGDVTLETLREAPAPVQIKYLFTQDHTPRK